MKATALSVLITGALLAACCDERRTAKQLTAVRAEEPRTVKQLAAIPAQDFTFKETITFETIKDSVIQQIRQKASGLEITDEGISPAYVTNQNGEARIGISVLTEAKSNTPAGGAFALLRTTIVPNLDKQSGILQLTPQIEIADFRISKSDIGVFNELFEACTWGKININDLLESFTKSIQEEIAKGIRQQVLSNTVITHVSDVRVGKSNLFVYFGVKAPDPEDEPASFEDTDAAISSVVPGHPLKTDAHFGNASEAALIVTLFRDNMQIHTFYCKAKNLDPTTHGNPHLQGWSRDESNHPGCCIINLCLGEGDTIMNMGEFYTCNKHGENWEDDLGSVIIRPGPKYKPGMKLYLWTDTKCRGEKEVCVVGSTSLHRPDNSNMWGHVRSLKVSQ